MRLRQVTPGATRRILEVCDVIGMGRTTGSANAGLNKSSGWLQESANPLFFGSTTGNFAPIISLNGTPWMRAASVLNVIHAKQGAYCAPLAQDLSLALAPPIALIRRLRRYGFAAIAWSDALTATPYAFQWTAGGTGLFSQWTAATGVEIISDVGINAGRWTVQYRRTNASGIVVHTDTGISPLNNPVVLEMVYVEGNPARLEVYINDILKATVTQAQLPILPITGTEFNPKITSGFNPGGAAGRNDYFRDAVFYIDEI